MTKVLVTESYLEDIADSIRAKNGSASTYTPAQMSGAIDALPSGGSVTQDANGYIVLPSTGGGGGGGGGGSSNVIVGTFTTSSTQGSHQTIQIPYTGNGYPILTVVEVSGGYYDPANTDFYDLIQRYLIGIVVISKNVKGTAPTYGLSGSNDATVFSSYKSSTSDATIYTRGYSYAYNVYGDTYASADSLASVRWIGNDEMDVYVASTGYGLKSEMDYSYTIVYSE